MMRWLVIALLSALPCSAIAQPVTTDTPAVTFDLQKTVFERSRELPIDTTIMGKVTRPAPGRRTAWTDLGEQSGLRKGDSLLIYRRLEGKRVPIARANVRLVESELSLITIDPLVRNATVQRDDEVDVWPMTWDRRHHTLTSYVLSVENDAPTPFVRIVGTAEDGLVAGRLADVYRGDAFVGVVLIDVLGHPLSTAQLIGSAVKESPQAGDRVVLHPSPNEPGRSLMPVIFKVQDEMCLLAAAESDGVQVDDAFIVRRCVDGKDVDIARLTIQAAKQGYAVARIVETLLADEPVRQWDIAHRAAEDGLTPHEIGRIVNVSESARTIVAEVDDGLLPVIGDVVRYTVNGGRNSGAAVVIQHDAQQIHCYVPKGWGGVTAVVGGRIEVEQLHASTQPSEEDGHEIP